MLLRLLKLKRLKKPEYRVTGGTRLVQVTKAIKLRPRGILMDLDPYFVYYTVMTGSEDQRLKLSIWTDIHTHTHTHTHTHIYFLFIYMCFVMYMLYIFMKNVLSASPRYN